MEESILPNDDQIDPIDDDEDISVNDDVGDDMDTSAHTDDVEEVKEELPVERRSKRLASKPKQMRRNLEDFGLVKGERLWKEKEKKQFLDACAQLGSKEVREISEQIPTKHFDVVKNLILREKRNQNYTIETQFVEDSGDSAVLDDGEFKGRGGSRPRGRIDLPDATPQGQIVEVLKRRQRNAPIEMWIDSAESKVAELEKKTRKHDPSFNGDYSSIIPSMLQWIGDHESHPPPSECGGVDYAAIYRYLARLCEGEAPPDLDPVSSVRVRRLLGALVRALTQLGLEPETAYLETFRGPHSNYPATAARPDTSTSLAVETLARVGGLNPMEFNPDMFIKKEIPKLGDLIKITSEEIVDDGIDEASEVSMNLKPF